MAREARSVGWSTVEGRCRLEGRGGEVAGLPGRAVVGDGGGEARAALLGELAEESDGVLEAAWRRLVGLSGYGRLGSEQAEAVRVAVGQAFWVILTAAREDRGLDLDERACFEAMGAERAAMGVDRAEAAEAFDLVFDGCFRRLLDLGLARGEPEAGRVLGRLSGRLRRLAESARTAIVRGHDRQAGRQLARVSGDRAALAETVLGGQVDEGELEQRAAAAGVSARGPWTLLVALPPDRTGDAGPDVGLLAAGRALADATEGLAASPRDEPWPHVAVVVPGVALGDVTEAGGQVAADRGLVVVGATRRCAGPVGAVYRQTRPYLQPLRRLAAYGQVTRLDDLQVYEPFVWCPPAVADRIVTDTLAGVLDDRRGRTEVWIDTLEAMVLYDGVVQAAAEVLNITGRAVRYRLERIGEASGIDLDRPGVRFRVGQAVCLYRLHPPDTDDSSSPADD